MAKGPNASPCPNCDSRSLYWTTTASGGTHGPYLLPGLGGFLNFAEVRVVLCTDCGLVRLFATEDALQKLAGSKGKTPLVDWHRQV